MEKVMLCPFCGKNQYPQNPDPHFNPGNRITEESRVALAFDSGRVYNLPMLLCHYILAHEYQPPAAFIGDVMNARPIPLAHVQAATVGAPCHLNVGTNYPMGGVPDAMPWRLKTILESSTVTSPRAVLNGGPATNVAIPYPMPEVP